MVAASPLAHAQQNHAQVAVPFYRPSDAAQGLYRTWLQPRAEAFAREAAALPPPVRALCDVDPSSPAGTAGARDAARAAWQRGVDAWERLAVVPLGPLIERRALRQIDFTPTRPELIARAVQRQPSGEAEMDRIGTPAKGLPALEWLLWVRPAAPGTPACGYAVQVADDLARQAEALQQAVAAAAAQDWDEARGDAAFAEFINQWVGAVERLRWANIDKPRREAVTRGQRSPAYPRQASGQTAASWNRHWQALRDLAIFQGGEPARPGQGVVPLETYLRGRGLNPLADRWAAQVARAHTAMQGLQPTAGRGLDRAVRELAALKAMAETELAPALEISIGFSDADGD
jgi:hypothetical protein